MNENNEILETAAEENNAVETNEVVETTETVEKQPNKCFGISALVFGILSLVTFVFPLPLGSYFPLVGVIFGIADKAKNGKMTSQGKAGFICSIVAYAIYVLAILLVYAVIALGFVYLPEILEFFKELLPPELLDMMNSL